MTYKMRFFLELENNIKRNNKMPYSHLNMKLLFLGN